MDQTKAQHTGYASANGVNIYYGVYGAGQPLLLLHGGTLTSHMWQPFIPQFAQHFQVIALDSRGHGKTDNRSGKMSYRAMADDVAAFIQALHLTKPLVCGYSDGGQIGLELGMNYSGLTRAIVNAGVFFRFTPLYFDFLKEFGIDEKGQVDFEYLQHDKPGVIGFWQSEHAHPNDPNRWKTMLQQAAVLWTTPLDYTATEFQRITDPTMVIMGDRDGISPIEESVEMYRMIPNAELAVLPNATHETMLSTDGSFVPITLAFLLRHATSH